MVYHRERWEEVPEFPNYLVSDFGNVENIKYRRPLEIKQRDDGYWRVRLTHRGRAGEFYIHRLVFQTFRPDEYRDGLFIRHRDRNKSNNRLENLYSIADDQRHFPPREIYGGRPVMIRETQEVYPNALAAARAINGNETCIHRCLRGERNTHLGYTFVYVG